MMVFLEIEFTFYVRSRENDFKFYVSEPKNTLVGFWFVLSPSTSLWIWMDTNGNELAIAFAKSRAANFQSKIVCPVPDTAKDRCFTLPGDEISLTTLCAIRFIQDNQKS